VPPLSTAGSWHVDGAPVSASKIATPEMLRGLPLMPAPGRICVNSPTATILPFDAATARTTAFVCQAGRLSALKATPGVMALAAGAGAAATTPITSAKTARALANTRVRTIPHFPKCPHRRVTPHAMPTCAPFAVDPRKHDGRALAPVRARI